MNNGLSRIQGFEFCFDPILPQISHCFSSIWPPIFNSCWFFPFPSFFMFSDLSFEVNLLTSNCGFVFHLPPLLMLLTQFFPTFSSFFLSSKNQKLLKTIQGEHSYQKLRQIKINYGLNISTKLFYLINNLIVVKCFKITLFYGKVPCLPCQIEKVFFAAVWYYFVPPDRNHRNGHPSPP